MVLQHSCPRFGQRLPSQDNKSRRNVWQAWGCVLLFSFPSLPARAFVTKSRMSKKPFISLYMGRMNTEVAEQYESMNAKSNLFTDSHLENPFAPIRNIADKNMTTAEMAVLSATGTLFTLGILYTLAMSTDDPSLLEGGQASFESLEIAGYNIVDAALPMTASDIVSVAIGEVMAGAIGAAASLGISRSMMQWRKSLQPNGTLNNPVKVSDAFADGEFLLTNAAAKPLLEAIGLPPFLASITATVLAIVPYGFIKAGARRREQRRLEDELLEQLLAEEQERKLKNRITFGKFAEIDLKKSVTVDVKKLSPVQEPKLKLDWVESFSDIIKWLQFDALQSDFGGHLTWQGYAVFPGIESGIFGGITALTSQVYADVLYVYFGFGGDSMQEVVRSRTLPDWATLYLTKIVYCAVLFGVYEVVQYPVQEAVVAFASGGVDACVGSNDYGACIDTFVSGNPTGASPEAELRSLLTAALSLWNNYGVPSWTIPGWTS